MKNCEIERFPVTVVDIKAPHQAKGAYQYYTIGENEVDYSWVSWDQKEDSHEDIHIIKLILNY